MSCSILYLFCWLEILILICKLARVSPPHSEIFWVLRTPAAETIWCIHTPTMYPLQYDLSKVLLWTSVTASIVEPFFIRLDVWRTSLTSLPIIAHWPFPMWCCLLSSKCWRRRLHAFEGRGRSFVVRSWSAATGLTRLDTFLWRVEVIRCTLITSYFLLQ